MSADQRVTAAREFLASAQQRKVTELPPSLLMRECAELRRLLRQVLGLIPAPLSAAQRELLAQVFTDADAWRLRGIEGCTDCHAARDGICERHRGELDRTVRYDELARVLAVHGASYGWFLASLGITPGSSPASTYGHSHRA